MGAPCRETRLARLLRSMKALIGGGTQRRKRTGTMERPTAPNSTHASTFLNRLSIMWVATGCIASAVLEAGPDSNYTGILRVVAALCSGLSRVHRAERVINAE